MESALEDVAQEFRPDFVDRDVLEQAIGKSSVRGATKIRRHEEAVSVFPLALGFGVPFLFNNAKLRVSQVSSILEFASRPGTHVSQSCMLKIAFSNSQPFVALLLYVVALRPTRVQVPVKPAEEGCCAAACRRQVLR